MKLNLRLMKLNYRKVIRWHDKPSSEKSYNYLIASSGTVIHKELSKFNNKVTFHTSAYVFSDWIDEYDPNALELGPNSSEFAKIFKNNEVSLGVSA